jgi:hypothetical protein
MSSYGAKGTRMLAGCRDGPPRGPPLNWSDGIRARPAKIWVGTSDQQLMALSNEFPGFYRHALIMEEASSRAQQGITAL